MRLSASVVFDAQVVHRLPAERIPVPRGHRSRHPQEASRRDIFRSSLSSFFLYILDFSAVYIYNSLYIILELDMYPETMLHGMTLFWFKHDFVIKIWLR
jgi:hypothetical protein